MRLLVVLAVFASPALGAPPVTLDSLLKEMVDRDAIARFPSPAYTCGQFSSYDRASRSPQDEKGWFANGDASQYLRVETVTAFVGGQTTTRREWVMMDAPGPGAVVRIWSANPKGTLRVYLDRADTPVIEATMELLLGGHWSAAATTVGAPLAGVRSKGWNLYLPIPYAEHCKITSDSDGFYYQINYRTYEPGTDVVSYSVGEADSAAATLAAVQQRLLAPPDQSEYQRHDAAAIAPGDSRVYAVASGRSGAITGIQLDAEAQDLEQALRSTVIKIEFDDRQTVWCPLSDFFGSGVGKNDFRTWWTGVDGSKLLSCWWVMPFERSARITLHNTGKSPARFQLQTRIKDWSWDDRSMHFHATWHAQHPIHAFGGRGTVDFNYVEVVGRGVYAGDSLAIVNPVPEWWGEGDEKIFVDGESFPSHFGTGTEDYYGYAWCWPEPFTHPFHAQPRCDGWNGGIASNNWGHTSVLRVRSLDAIPFKQSLRVNMEVWHWRESDVAYAATAYFYARPGATTNRPPQPEAAAAPIPRPPPLPPPFRIEGAVECESAKIVAKSEGLPAIGQDMRQFARGKWSGEGHLWVQGRRPGDFIELEIPVGDAPDGKPVAVTIHATSSWDYGVVRFTVNGQKAGDDLDLFSGGQGRCAPKGPIDLGTFAPADGKLTLRVEVVGGNEKALGSKSFFGLDCVVLTPK